MLAIFYAVPNTKCYSPESFTNMTDEEFIEKLSALPMSQIREYDMSNRGACPINNADDFVNDYNNEELDGCWFCRLVELTSAEYLDIIFKRR